ncbi:chordopoxvirus fusion protein [Desulfoglaeba alkanexedens]|uniref:Chordopoxvirus fusion protein n=1 Tax=Desulfoglaeba alkanexedens ALDC TaxID=980445 RepID=A0A4P8L0N9_9BACT|nr:chordopoxvirus fusion protein [Desulfoglaeba alkanexedens]QCQ21358.1 chordopoxvirus fusion protein [Desulfoglaeba alkanexedens ALDC]
MLKYLEAIEELPKEFKVPFTKVLELFREEIAETIKKSDFEELKAVVTRLAYSQEELAEAQKRTEKRLEELAEAQKRTEKRLEELAEAQKRTEKRLEELAEAQKRTEKRLEELAEAQKTTEKEIASLSRALKETRKEVGGLSHTIGYTLENEAFKALPSLLKAEFGLEVEGKLKRDFLKDSKGQEIEVNILGKARKDGQELVIVGESKSQLSRKDIDSFLRRLNFLESAIPGDKFCLFITHMARPETVVYAREKGIRVYFSYEF